MVRRVFFWCLVLIFCTATPLLIGYALGYRYNFDRGIFVFAGSITIKSNPEQVSIDINGEPASAKQRMSFFNNSYHIDGLRPGDYTVRVWKEGFYDWKKTIQVQSGVSTEFWNILLPRTDYPQTEYGDTENTQRFFPAPKSNTFALARNNPETPFSLKLVLVDTDNATSTEIYSSDTLRLISDTLQNIEWSPKEDFLLVPVELAPEKKEKNQTAAVTAPIVKHLLVSTDTATTPFFLEDILPTTTHPENARWSPKENNTVYFLDNGTLEKMNVSEKTAPETVSENVLGYDFYVNTIVILRKENHILYRYGLDAKEALQVTTTPLSENNTDPHRIIAYDDRKVAFINSNKELFIHNTYKDKTFDKKIADSVDGAQFSNDGKKLLYWNDHEAFVYFTEKWETQPQRQEDSVQQIARLFNPAKNMQWTKDYEHVLYSQGKELHILSLDTRGGQDGYTIKTLSLDTPNVLVSPRDDRLYYTDTQNGSTRFFSVNFPEKTTFFGF